VSPALAITLFEKVTFKSFCIEQELEVVEPIEIFRGTCEVESKWRSNKPCCKVAFETYCGTFNTAWRCYSLL